MCGKLVNNYMNIQKNAIKTDYGYKIKKNKDTYYHMVETKCSFCNKLVYKEKRNLKTSNNAFCDKICQSKFRHMLVDPIGHNILSQKDTSVFCYLIGLICTDGHITYPPKYVHYSCSIYLKDKEHIEKLKKQFGGRQTKCNIHTWTINNIDFINYLKNVVKITNNKSRTINVNEWFNSLSTINKKHFIRGVFDGDGGICCNKYGRWRVYFTSGSECFINMLHKYMNYGKLYTNRNAYNLQITKKKDIIDLLTNIYEDSELYLERKLEKSKLFLKENYNNG